MPADASRASDRPGAIAPDGIPIYTFATLAGLFVGVAEGRIPAGSYGIHRHLSLEQYTYVLEGQVSVVTGDDSHPQGRVVKMTPGDLLLTLPGESLQFINESDEAARVLFICAPPYPPDNSDTRILTAHGPAGGDEADETIARLETIRGAFNAAVDARIAARRRDEA